jgi:hypothetical protein
MKRLLIASLSTLVLAIAPAYSEAMTAANSNTSQNIVEVSPFNLVYHGYQGYFSDMGIPSNGAFLTAIHSGKVQARDLVKVAIDKGRLSPDTINDRGYLNAVQSQLNNLDRN